METVAQPDQGHRDNVMQNELFEILSGLLQHEQQDNSLLRPVTCLQQIVGLEDSFVATMREALKHSICVEVPDWRTVHDVQAKGTENGKIDGCVELFHESGLLCFSGNAEMNGKGTNHALHEELAGEAQDNGVEGDKREISFALAILDWFASRSV